MVPSLGYCYLINFIFSSTYIYSKSQENYKEHDVIENYLQEDPDFNEDSSSSPCPSSSSLSRLSICAFKSSKNQKSYLIMKSRPSSLEDNARAPFLNLSTRGRLSSLFLSRVSRLSTLCFQKFEKPKNRSSYDEITPFISRR